jgi:imidazoleglycerol-phosphate dehydratase
MSNRNATVNRKTSETEISVRLDLDGSGESEILTGVGFFDHMLTQIARHGLLHLAVSAIGDHHIDDHHTVEDVGIAFGTALQEAIRDKQGITRYGHAIVPMDEALILCAVDFSGRGLFVEQLALKSGKIGTFDVELVPEFFQAVAANAKMTVHIQQFAGNNTHHIIEGAFKAFGRALAAAVAIDPRIKGIPSSKGTL